MINLTFNYNKILLKGDLNIYFSNKIEFEEILREAVDAGDNPKIEGIRTNSKHISINPLPKIETISEKIITENSTIMRNDGNNVDIEREQAEFAKNNIRGVKMDILKKGA